MVLLLLLMMMMKWCRCHCLLSTSVVVVDIDEQITHSILSSSGRRLANAISPSSSSALSPSSPVDNNTRRSAHVRAAADRYDHYSAVSAKDAVGGGEMEFQRRRRRRQSTAAREIDAGQEARGVADSIDDGGRRGGAGGSGLTSLTDNRPLPELASSASPPRPTVERLSPEMRPPPTTNDADGADKSGQIELNDTSPDCRLRHWHHAHSSHRAAIPPILHQTSDDVTVPSQVHAPCWHNSIETE